MMCLKLLHVCTLYILIKCVVEVSNTQSHSHPGPQTIIFYPCKDQNDIKSVFFRSEMTEYMIAVNRELEVTTEFKVKLDSGANIQFGYSSLPSTDARFTETDLINNVFGFILRKNVSSFVFTIRGKPPPEHPPYILSLKINGEENCKEPDRTYFGTQGVGIKELWPEAPDKFCGRRRINRDYTALIVSGTASKIGNWPWHVAIYRNHRLSIQYICGGTLLSEYVVLTAAHCVTINGVRSNPQSIGVVLGRTSLISNERTSQDRTVYQIIVHDGFEKKSLNDDIALLKLGAEAIFNNYVQPACLWFNGVYDQLDSYEVTGTVVGWGIDQTDSLVNDLHEATMPIASKLSCITYDPIFYSNMLANDKKFCAGLNNGTAACNGDSGGGFMVFVPDSRDPEYRVDYKTGAWYVKGIVSVSLAQKDSSYCEPNAYTVYTDVEKYRKWILDNMK